MSLKVSNKNRKVPKIEALPVVSNNSKELLRNIIFIVVSLSLLMILIF